ncbi:hypothetical protein RB614_29020 [Phytohabitans sp. ZYX-F-186]|uniref:Major facilitator superfamily (MFS) profile domain-containing protein n=1 Tax=Phytohabitans maris TaxID=3071409 RepID=A0ABU0ZNG7_9ACTN|nr:hypothetical protein [Phytohabitans sp. ZYX-F-186]MDQ7908580.1 hypothetical protein [Phytohabitans sp. ZYX-F-186]
MADDGGAGRKPPLRPRYRRPEPERPASRPASVWVVSVLLVLFGVLGAVLGVLLVRDAVAHGEEDEVVAAGVFAVLLAAAQVVSGVGVFAGWARGRVLAMLVCAANVVLVIVGAATDRVGSGQSWLAIAFYGALLFGLAGPKISDWCK